jgi:transposase
VGPFLNTGPRKQRSRLIDPYKPYVLARGPQGCHTGSQLERELRAQGYKGSPRALYRYLATLGPAVNSAARRGFSSAVKQPAIPSNPLFTLSVQQATWLLFRKADELKQEEREHLQQLRQASPEIETAYQLVEQFLRMVRERSGEQLAAWLAEVQASQLVAFDSFVTGVQHDQDAVLAGLTLPWSTNHVA